MVQETEVQFQVELYQRLKNMVLDAALLNTQHYKVAIKGKVEQSREWKGAFGSFSTKAANFTYLYHKSLKMFLNDIQLDGNLLVNVKFLRWKVQERKKKKKKKKKIFFFFFPPLIVQIPKASM